MLVAVTTTDRRSDPNDRADRTTAAGPPAGHRATDAAAHFGAKLRFETDPSDVAAARAAGVGPVLVDVRDAASWEQGHVPGALHLPASDIPARIGELPPVAEDPELVVYCWGPGCNGSTKAALALSRAGYRSVREMIGGFEYWVREGLAIEAAGGRTRRPVDDLTAPLAPARTAPPVGD